MPEADITARVKSPCHSVGGIGNIPSLNAIFRVGNVNRIPMLMYTTPLILLLERLSIRALQRNEQFYGA